MRRNCLQAVILACAGYLIVGIGTAAFGGPGHAGATVRASRAAAWLLSLAIFAVHLGGERRRHARAVTAAAHVALAVAIGALGLALWGPVRSHWGDPARGRLVLLSVVAWPVLTGGAAFVVALIVGLILGKQKSTS